ncbi:transglycosylase domain-containing protein [Flavobacterium sediminilitoris]|uniref:Transglycosylase domain-containing protein n=1 Tax=Flavobacterium sediminilitoris TaxID=2024526 RepID=A0ABY4HRB7_9FLAO|nr:MULTISPECIES: transglycosylase domain-containing protein [Flavobacterium]UOX35150.1 transglycosylase domain-containing protein [Flavobacterium sediminilitoris]
MATKKKETNNYSKYIKIFWKTFLFGLTSVILLFLFASWGFFGAMPTFENLENPDSNVATEIISSDGVVLGKFYTQNRIPVKYEDLPKDLINALIATEDERFYEHSGIDPRGTIRAIAKLGTDGGASTISQQLAKNLFHGSDGARNIFVRVIQKVKEWIIAVRLERQYTKKEIIAMYLNQVDFVNGAIGIRSASKIYFNKEPKDLKVEEAAVFVGMLTNPSLYNPNRETRKKLVLDRRNTVLGQMVRSGFLTEAKKIELQKTPLVLDFKPESHNEGIATYFREYLKGYMKDWVKEHKKDDGSEYDIYRDGLKIYTTIDSRMQKYAEESVEEHLTNLQAKFFELAKGKKNAPFVNLSDVETEKIIKRSMKNSERWRILKEDGKSDAEILKSFEVKAKMKIFSWKGEKDTIMTPRDSIIYYKHMLQTGMMAMEPQTGHIKAWVGGNNYKYFQYDHVGQGARQVGSTFKPFVYSTAIEQLGMSPCDSIIDGPFTMPKGRWGISSSWTPRNSSHKYYGMKDLKFCLANSINTVSAKLMDRVGPKAVVNMAHDLGVTTDIPEQPAIALGAVEITVSEMVGAFSTFVNQGVYIKPTFITRIEDKNGVILEQIIPESKDVMNKDVAYAIVKLMEGVVQSGTSARLRNGSVRGLTNYKYKFNNPIAGKTGTTQNNSDGWFIGMVPNLSAGIWVGNEDRAAHFRSTNFGQGATMALPIWGLFMDKCYKDKELNVSKGAFERPDKISISVDCDKTKVTTDSIDVDAPDMNEFDL